MCDYKISDRAYTKLIFHAAKYPHLAVNGLLLSEKPTKGSVVEIVDAIPLFHQCLHVTPMAEVALMQVIINCRSLEHVGLLMRILPSFKCS